MSQLYNVSAAWIKTLAVNGILQQGDDAAPKIQISQSH